MALITLLAALLLMGCSTDASSSSSSASSRSPLPSPGRTSIAVVPAGSTVTLLNGLSVYVPETAAAELLRTGSPGGGVPPERLTIRDAQFPCGSFAVYSDPDRGGTMPSVSTALAWRRLARLDDGTEVRWTGSKTAGLWVVVLTHVPGHAPGMVSAVWFRKPSPTVADVRSVVTQIWQACRIRGAGEGLIHALDASSVPSP